MFSRLFKAGVTATTVTAAVLFGKGYQQSLHSEAKTNHETTEQTSQLLAGGDCFSIEKARDAARELVLRRKEECGAPGVTIAVSKNGLPVWAEGFGYADVENLTPMTPRHVLRIASISKPMTMALVGRAVDRGVLDVSATVHHYLPNYPRHTIDGQTADMTVDQVAMHRAGIRHYHKKPEVDIMNRKAEHSKKNKLAHEILLEQENNGSSTSAADNGSATGGTDCGNENSHKNSTNATEQQKRTGKKSEAKIEQAKVVPAKEFNTAVKYQNVGEALDVFKDDELLYRPGSDFHYSTHGFTLMSAVLEAATGTRFSDLLLDMFHAMDLRSTHLDENEPIIRNRAKYYVRRQDGRLQNAPHVDNSWKIAGGGLLSTPTDLCRFGDTMLYSWQWDGAGRPAGYLRPQTARWLWTAPDEPAAFAASRRRRHWSPYRYARGWQVRRSQPELGVGPGAALVACHTGGAAGASSVLLVRPDGERSGADGRPRGVTVAVIVNTEGVGLRELADDVARLFAD